jgi:multicomponent Na+:H+ antiporter subunit E
MLRRYLALFVWAYLTWMLLTWTATLEQALWGVGVAGVVAAALAPLGPVAAPWRLLEPRRLVVVLRLAGTSLVQIVRANLSLARRIWSPSLRVPSGMLVVPTIVTTDGGLTAVGLISSVIVDHQLVDVAGEPALLQYHAVEVVTEHQRENEERINGPIERLIHELEAT